MLRRWRRLWAASLIGALLLVSGCGGGSSSSLNVLNTSGNGGSGVGTGGTGSYTNGPISGLGSIIVNNVRYDVSGAQVTLDDGTAYGASGLGLGMVVEVQGSGVTPGVNGAPGVASAAVVRVGSELVGRITMPFDAGCACLKVLGQTVHIDTKTVLAPALSAGDVVAVYGLSDAAGAYTATRIDKLDAATSVYKIAGVVASVGNGQLAMGQAGSIFVSLQSLDGDDLPAGLTAGARARVWFSAAQVNGLWVATRLRLDAALVEDMPEASVEGLVTQLPDAYGVMRVSGTMVDTRGLSVVPTFTLGQRAHAEGRLQGGVLYASELSREDADEIDQSEIELHGQISALNTTAQTFVLRGVVVAYGGATVEPVGGLLATGPLCAEVKGLRYDALGQLLATKVAVASSCE